ncbi:rhomboid family intramembrane serine protease [Methanolapillus millepedarum]|uniref:Rhomboid protease GlpG n=1 Tax=Methanolapillus millepedarum TaxID=3028296 RepID=A0AA97A4P9_9EURY|nr:Rhomboid protease GlpG [Methanosarcinaceae archaeon Ac7]
MTKCHACGKEEPAQPVCNVCGKTYCEEHISQNRHICFKDPKGVNVGNGTARVYVKTYGTGAAAGTNPPKADYYDQDNFEKKHGYSAKRRDSLWKMIFGSPTYTIILICVLMQIIEVIGFVFNFTPFLYVFYYLSLQPNLPFITSYPWSLVTHMFLHAPVNITHILFNMMTLFFFGTYLEKVIGKKAFIATYLVSGIVAAIGFVAVEILTSGPSTVPLVGASGAIMGVLAAIAIINPNLQVYIYFIPAKIKYLIIFYAIFDFVFMGSGDSIAHAAHLSGLFIGLWIGYYYRKKLRSRRPQEF